MSRNNRNGDDVNGWYRDAKNTPILDILSRLYAHHLTKSGRNCHGPCPKCGGTDRFGVDVSNNIWSCRQCPALPWLPSQKQAGGDSIDLVRHIEGCTMDEACERITGRPKPNASTQQQQSTVHQMWTTDAQFIYYAANNGPAHRVTRAFNGNKKTYWQERWDNGHWIKQGPKNGEHLPYRLPELIANRNRAQPYVVVVAEGEKCCDALADLGFVATCNIGGAGKWYPEMNEWFRGFEVIVCCDNDQPGHKHGEVVYANLFEIAKSVRVLHIEDHWTHAKPKEDIYDYIEMLKREGGEDCDLQDEVGKLLDKASNPLDFSIVTAAMGDLNEQAMSDQWVEGEKDLQYFSSHKEWLLTNGQVYRPDMIMEVRRRLDKFLKLRGKPLRAKIKEKVLSRKYADNIESLARSRLAVCADDFDNEKHVINSVDGPFDARKDALLPYVEENGLVRMHLKIARYAPRNEPTPLWTEFLDRITAGDEEKQRFLQRCAGYWATGEIKEQKLFFLWGTGSNGKSVFLTTIAHVLGDYAISAPVELLLKTPQQRHETEKAWLLGARMVRMNEPSEGERWHEGKLKEFTGEDRIAARKTMGNYFEFALQCKFVISGNNEPSFVQVDQAIRRRFVMIPFNVEIPEPERDVDLADKLKAEGHGILKWIIEGARCWYEAGLQITSAVKKASSDYLDEQDLTAIWIEQCCDLDPQSRERSSALYASWKQWAEANGEFIGSASLLVRRLNKKGLLSYRTNTGRGVIGIRIKAFS